VAVSNGGGVTRAVVNSTAKGTLRFNVPAGAQLITLSSGGSDTVAPAAPAALTVTPGDAKTTSNWGANTEADLAGYAIHCATSASGPFTRLNASLLSTRSYVDTAVSNGTTYWYRVTALDTAGNESAPSATVSATPQGAAVVRYRISGKVTANGQPLAGTNISAAGQTVSTAADGTYEVAGLPAGDTTVSASKSGYSFDGPLTVTVGPDKTGVNFTGTAVAAAAGFVKGINFGGGGVTIEGNRWLSYQEALSQGLTVSGGVPWSSTYSFPLSPSPDADTRAMLQSLVYRQNPPNGPGFSLGQALASGEYDLYVWLIENHANGFRDVTLRGEGVTLGTGLGSLARGEWKKYGPYRVNVQDGKLDLDVLRTGKGDPLIAGLAIFGSGSEPQAPAPSTYSISGTVASDGSGLAGATVAAGSAAASTDASGKYVLTGLAAGTYTVSASRSGYTFSAAQSVTVGPDRAGVNFTATAVLPSGFVKGINFGGGGVTIEGNRWLSYQEALSQGLTVSGGVPWSVGTYHFPLSPSPDADTRAMLQSVVYRQNPPSGQGFSFSQALPNGTYEFHVWLIENYADRFRDITLRGEGVTLGTGLGSLTRGEWKKYGPYRVNVQDGKLDLDLLRTSKGDPLIAGIAISRVE
jgi:hypothetical protein